MTKTPKPAPKPVAKSAPASVAKPATTTPPVDVVDTTQGRSGSKPNVVEGEKLAATTADTSAPKVVGETTPVVDTSEGRAPGDPGVADASTLTATAPDPFAAVQDPTAPVRPSPLAGIEPFERENPNLVDTLAAEPTFVPVHPSDATPEPERRKRKRSSRKPQMGAMVLYRHTLAFNGSDVLAAMVTGIPDDEQAEISLRVFPPNGEPFNATAHEAEPGEDDERKVWLWP